MKKEEIKYVNYQLIVLALTILAGCVSFFITYNQKRALEKKKPLIKNKALLTVSLMIGIINSPLGSFDGHNFVLHTSESIVFEGNRKNNVSAKVFLKLRMRKHYVRRKSKKQRLIKTF